MEGGSEGKLCQESNFPQSPKKAKPGTKDGSSVRNDPCFQNRFGPSVRGSKLRAIFATLRCRTKAAEIYPKAGNRSAVQLLLGHTKVDSTVRCLGVELEDALSIAERIDIQKTLADGSAARQY